MRDFKLWVVLPVVLLFLVFSEALAGQNTFELQGIYLEGCTCKLVCPCDLLGGMVKGCRVMGVMDISSGTYNGAKLSDVKVAAAVGHKWVRIYVQGSDAEQLKTAEEMARAIFGQFGKIEAVRQAKIELSGSDGNCTLKVDGGRVMELHTRPVLGADGKTPVTYVNYPDPLFQTISQGKTISGSFNDGGHRIKLKGTNSFFNQEWKVSGNL